MNFIACSSLPPSSAQKNLDMNNSTEICRILAKVFETRDLLKKISEFFNQFA